MKWHLMKWLKYPMLLIQLKTSCGKNEKILAMALWALVL
jgi:hypothetical protein